MNQQLQSFWQRGMEIFFLMGQTFSFSFFRIMFWNMLATLSKSIWYSPIFGFIITFAMGYPMKLNQLQPNSLLMKHSRKTEQNYSIEIYSSTGMLMKVRQVVLIFITILPRKFRLASIRNSFSSEQSYLTNRISGGRPESSKSMMTISRKLSLISSLRAMQISLEMVCLKSWLLLHSVQATKRKRFSKFLYYSARTQPVSRWLTFSREKSSVMSTLPSLVVQSRLTSSLLESEGSAICLRYSPQLSKQIMRFWQFRNWISETRRIFLSRFWCFWQTDQKKRTQPITSQSYLQFKDSQVFRSRYFQRIGPESREREERMRRPCEQPSVSFRCMVCSWVWLSLRSWPLTRSKLAKISFIRLDCVDSCSKRGWKYLASNLRPFLPSRSTFTEQLSSFFNLKTNYPKMFLSLARNRSMPSRCPRMLLSCPWQYSTLSKYSSWQLSSAASISFMFLDLSISRTLGGPGCVWYRQASGAKTAAVDLRLSSMVMVYESRKERQRVNITLSYFSFCCLQKLLSLPLQYLTFCTWMRQFFSFCLIRRDKLVNSKYCFLSQQMSSTLFSLRLLVSYFCSFCCSSFRVYRFYFIYSMLLADMDISFSRTSQSYMIFLWIISSSSPLDCRISSMQLNYFPTFQMPESTASQVGSTIYSLGPASPGFSLGLFSLILSSLKALRSSSLNSCANPSSWKYCQC